ncbi:MAG: hypothetical protein IPP72_14320 [Chitinophagaceae bacterium]|nr:hypothetical protein [Chitinophagaceae bacterium]
MLQHLLFLSAVFLFSCHPSGKMTAEKRKDYYKHFNKITGHSDIDLYKFDSVGYANFILKEDPSNLVSIIYGYFLNDTLKITPELLKDPTPNCKTVVLNEVKKNISEPFNRELSVRNDFVFTSHLINMKTNSSYKNGTSTKKKLVVLYGLKMQHLFKKFFNSFYNLCVNNNYELIVLSLDPLWGNQ